MDEAAINRKFWIIVGSFAFLLLAAGGCFFLLYQDFSANTEELESKKGELEKLEKKHTELVMKKREMERNKKAAEAYEKYLPSQQDIPGLLKIIATMATDNNLLLNYAAIAAPKAKKKAKSKELYETRVFNLQLVGHYPDIIAFVNNVENLDRFMMVNKIAINPVKLTRTVEVEGVWVDPSAPPFLAFEILVYTFVYAGGATK